MSTVIQADRMIALVHHVDSWRPIPEIENALCDWLDQLVEDSINSKIYNVEWEQEQIVLDHPTEGDFFKAVLKISTLNEEQSVLAHETVFIRITHNTFFNDGSEGWEVS